MSESVNKDDKFVRLREQAEELIRQGQADFDPESADNMRELIQELKVHQAELEIQNQELKRSQQEVAELQRKYHDLYEFAPFGYLTLNPKGIITGANLTAVSLLGRDRSILLMSSFTAFIAPKWANEYQRAKQKAIEGGEKQSVELQLQTGSQRLKWVLVDIDAEKDDQDCLLQLRMNLVDISERIKAETEKEQLRSQMLQARKMQSIGILAKGVAHEFNNLLQVMSGNIQLLLMRKSADGMEYQRLRSVEKAIHRAAKFVNQLLLFSSKSETSRRSVDLRQEVEEAVRILKQTIPRMVQIQCNLENDLWHIYADPVQIEQVVLNLGKNAADAMPQGGRMHIEAKNVHLSDELQPADRALKPGDYVLLRIKDTGHGMDPEILEHIFDPFFTTKEVGSGTGLGLSTVYGIVQTHQGHIQCHSQPREGTVFSIYWPATQTGDKAEPKQEQSAEELPQGTGTILVVDDEGAYIDMMQTVLSQSGYTVLVAANGEEALQIYSKQSAGIDLVILDLSMSGMGGEQCLQEILKTDPEARILVASGYSSEHAAKNIMQKEAVAFIGKPFKLSDLLSKVQDMLNNGEGVNNN